MILDIKDRTYILFLLKTYKPKGFIDEILMGNIIKSIAFSSEEIEKYNIEEDENGNILWKENGKINILLTKQELSLIKKIIKSSDEVTDDILDLFNKL